MPSSALLFAAAILLSFVLTLCQASSAVTVKIWSLKGDKTRIMTYEIPETNHCYEFDRNLLATRFYATWTALPSNTKMVFYNNLECLSVGIVHSAKDAGSVRFKSTLPPYSFLLHDETSKQTGSWKLTNLYENPNVTYSQSG